MEHDIALLNEANTSMRRYHARFGYTVKLSQESACSMAPLGRLDAGGQAKILSERRLNSDETEPAMLGSGAGKRDSYQGMPSGMPLRAGRGRAGFSRCAVTGKLGG